MTDPRDLLRRRAAPPPVAVTMTTEIRSDGGVFFKVLQGPSWAYGLSNASIWQWSAPFGRQAIDDLWTHLRKPNAIYGIQTDALIDFALKKFHIGRYLGTLIDTGVTPLLVRMVFGIEPDWHATDRQLLGLIRDLMKFGGSASEPSAAQRPKPPVNTGAGEPAPTDQEWHQIYLGAKELNYLRAMWSAQSGRTESRSLLLTQIDIQDFNASGDYSPFGDGKLPSSL
jgi:hypothetical protein